MGAEPRGVFGQWPEFVGSGFKIDLQKGEISRVPGNNGKSEDALAPLAWLTILARSV